MLEVFTPNQDARPCPVDMLILHYTGMQSAEAALARLRDPAAKVSAHYLVDEEGNLFRLVPEARRAWHAGVSAWRGRRDCNDFSVGVEIVNPGHEWGYRAFPEAQIAAVRALCLGIMGRHGISPLRVLGHSDVAPARKQDPGELFPWGALAATGVGAWPAACGGRVEDAAAALAGIGYEIGDPRAALVAFQRHFLPERVTGEACTATRARLADCALLFGPP